MSARQEGLFTAGSAGVGVGNRPFPTKRSAQTKARRSKQTGLAAGSEWG